MILSGTELFLPEVYAFQIWNDSLYPKTETCWALTHLQSLPVKATLESQKLSQKLLQLSIALKVQAPDVGRIVNIYA